MKDKCPCPSLCSCYFKSIANNVRRLQWLIEHLQPQIKLTFFFPSDVHQHQRGLNNQYILLFQLEHFWIIRFQFRLLVAPKCWLWINLHKVTMLHTFFPQLVGYYTRVRDMSDGQWRLRCFPGCEDNDDPKKCLFSPYWPWATLQPFWSGNSDKQIINMGLALQLIVLI